MSRRVHGESELEAQARAGPGMAWRLDEWRCEEDMSRAFVHESNSAAMAMAKTAGYEARTTPVTTASTTSRHAVPRAFAAAPGPLSSDADERRRTYGEAYEAPGFGHSRQGPPPGCERRFASAAIWARAGKARVDDFEPGVEEARSWQRATSAGCASESAAGSPACPQGPSHGQEVTARRSARADGGPGRGVAWSLDGSSRRSGTESVNINGYGYSCGNCSGCIRPDGVGGSGVGSGSGSGAAEAGRWAPPPSHPPPPPPPSLPPPPPPSATAATMTAAAADRGAQYAPSAAAAGPAGPSTAEPLDWLFGLLDETPTGDATAVNPATPGPQSKRPRSSVSGMDTAAAAASHAAATSERRPRLNPLSAWPDDPAGHNPTAGPRFHPYQPQPAAAAAARATNAAFSSGASGGVMPAAAAAAAAAAAPHSSSGGGAGGAWNQRSRAHGLCWRQDVSAAAGGPASDGMLRPSPGARGTCGNGQGGMGWGGDGMGYPAEVRALSVPRSEGGGHRSSSAGGRGDVVPQYGAVEGTACGGASGMGGPSLPRVGGGGYRHEPYEADHWSNAQQARTPARAWTAPGTASTADADAPAAFGGGFGSRRSDVTGGDAAASQTQWPRPAVDRRGVHALSEPSGAWAEAEAVGYGDLRASYSLPTPPTETVAGAYRPQPVRQSSAGVAAASGDEARRWPHQALWPALAPEAEAWASSAVPPAAGDSAALLRPRLEPHPGRSQLRSSEGPGLPSSQLQPEDVTQQPRPYHQQQPFPNRQPEPTGNVLQHSPQQQPRQPQQQQQQQQQQPWPALAPEAAAWGWTSEDLEGVEDTGGRGTPTRLAAAGFTCPAPRSAPTPIAGASAMPQDGTLPRDPWPSHY